MARIPTSTELGRVQPQSTRGFVPGPRDALSPAIRRAGQTMVDISGQLAAKAREDQQEAEQVLEYQTESQFQNLQNEIDQNNVEAQADADPAAIGFARQRDTEYDAAAKRFMEGVPEHLKPKYDVKLVNLRGKVFQAADSFERASRGAYWKDQIEQDRRNAALIVRENPAKLQEQIEFLNEKIGTSGLSKTEQTDMRRIMQPELVAQAVIGLDDAGDVEGGRALLDQYVQSATARGSAAVSGGDAVQTVVDRIIQEESANNPTARPRDPKTGKLLSTALGLGQHIEGTWMSLINKYRPDITAGRTRKEILALRTNPELSREMTARYAEENARILRANGLKPTAGNIYLAHFLGPAARGGAVGVLNASDDTPLKDILAPSKIQANKFMRGKTVGWLKNWSNRKMGDATAVIDIGPAWVEGLRQRLDSSEEKMNQQEEDDLKITRSETAKTGYELLYTGDITEDWVLENRDLLNRTDFRALLRGATQEEPKKTDPVEHIRLLDLADSNPEQAVRDVRQQYAEDLIARDVFQTVMSRAQKNLKKEGAQPYEKEVRSYVRTLLKPEADAPRSHYSRQLDAAFAFDDWADRHPKASREEMRRAADDIVKNYRQLRYRQDATSLPVPQFLDITRPLTPEALVAAIKKTTAGFQRKEITKAELARQAALLKRWAAAIGQRNE